MRHSLLQKLDRVNPPLKCNKVINYRLQTGDHLKCIQRTLDIIT